MDVVSLTNWVKFGQYQLSVSSQFNLCTEPVSRNIYVLYWRTFIIHSSKLERRTHFGKFLKDFAGRAENFQILLRRGRVECCLFTPWESNLFVTHNQYPAKNHHLRQNQRFSPPLKVNFKKIFKLLLRILLHQTVQLELSNVDNRLQFSFWLGTSQRKTCNLPSSIDNVRFCNLFAWKLLQV